MPVTIPLSAPLKTHQGEVRELSLRDLTAQDMVDMVVSPVSISVKTGATNAEAKVEVRYDVAMRYLVKLTGHDEIVLGAMKAQDFVKAANKLNEMLNVLGE